MKNKLALSIMACGVFGIGVGVGIILTKKVAASRGVAL